MTRSFLWSAGYALVILGTISCGLLARPDARYQRYRVSSVSNELVVILENGPRVRLAGIRITYPPAGPLYQEMLAYSRANLVGRVVQLVGLKMNREPTAYLMIVDSHPAVLFNSGLLAWGFATIDSDTLIDDFREAMLSSEADARDERLGIWANSR